MKTVLHKADKRGYADHGWLQAKHSFSFANYYDNEKMHFGKLRVLNDDVVAPGKGFDLHPHQDMEIITIPLSGAVRHGDNIGNEEIITNKDVQVMSAGTGIWHLEYNASEMENLNLLQIWIFPNKKGHRPRYEQKAFLPDRRINNWQLLVTPKGKDDSLSINQEAYLSMYRSNKDQNIQYELQQEGNGVYFMVVDGGIELNNQIISKRDAIGIWNFSGSVELRIQENSELLAIEVPMH